MTPYARAKAIFSHAFPSEVLRSQSSSDWLGEFPLPDPVAEYFSEFGPVNVWIEGYGNPYFFPSLSSLWNFQAGYRWDGFTGERVTDWEDDWIAIAAQGGDPFIFSRRSGVVLHAYHGEGKWEPMMLFAGLAEMATTVAMIGEIVEIAGHELCDQDSMILARHKDEARMRIADYLQSIEKANVALQRLDWG